MTPPRVFVDSSVLFSASVSSKGTARDLIVAGFEGHFVLCISEYVKRECRRNIGKKAPNRLRTLEMILSSDLFSGVDPASELVQLVAREFERKDAPIIAGAIAGQCTHLATYDRAHLLSQANRILDLHQIVVATPDDILRVQRKAT